MRRIAVAAVALSALAACARNHVSITGQSTSPADGGVRTPTPADGGVATRDLALVPLADAEAPSDAAAPPPDFAVGPPGAACPASSVGDSDACTSTWLSCGRSFAAVAVDGDDIYVGTWGPGAGVYRLRDQWLTPLGHTSLPPALLVDADALYVATDELVRMPKSGGTGTVLVPSDGHLIGGLRADADTLYWAESGGTQIRAIGKHGGVPRVIADEQPSPFSNFVVGGDHVYWGTYDQAGSYIRRAPTAGGAVETVFSDARAAVGPLAWAPEGTLFFVDIESTGLVALDPTSGAVTRFASLAEGHGVSSFGLVIDANVAYWEVWWKYTPDEQGGGKEDVFRLDRRTGVVTRPSVLGLGAQSTLAGGWLYAGDGNSLQRTCE